ncbi:putative methyltransferase-domain-containing protein [Phialemonium atrogriseum]|uniref:Methyltransferase-domain-containing protein n=1 Tax=Phialemonium atrogriseum TaxID=1093897 RepID=A0AAJ0C6A3_9PEZI|nr:putative methyltransferase-domain-containing protein [Phialemonium atrogriseum]KAK1770746.1 putative methyltransferase-domain-containing protein [Phialemonium atrogriseum]
MASDARRQPLPIIRFCRQYLQLESDLAYPDGILLRDERSQEFLYEKLFSPNAISRPAPPRYQLEALKNLVTRIEGAIEDWDEHGISDSLMTALSRLMSLPLPSETTAALQKSYVTYYQSLLPDPDPAASDPTITLLESRSLISAAGTTGLRTWEASLHLGQYLCVDPAIVRDRRVLELGAGTGYLSILCTKYLGAIHVVASDGSDDVINNLPDSLFINGLQGSDRIAPMDLKWGHALVGTEEPAWNGGREIDVVLGADITYDKALIPPLVGTLEELADLFPEVQILISATERNRDTFRHFLDVCQRSAFTVELVDFRVPRPEEQIGPFYGGGIPIHICRLRRLRRHY